MKKIITAALIAAVAMPAVALPAAADAQTRELRRDRHNIREQQRDVRQARQEYREDLNDRNRRWRDNDWQDWRNRNRGVFARGNWRAPFRYQLFRPGLRIGFDLFGPAYRISDPWRYHLPAPGYNQVWVRHYNDLLLVDTRRGVVIRVIRGFYW